MNNLGANCRVALFLWEMCSRHLNSGNWWKCVVIYSALIWRWQALSNIQQQKGSAMSRWQHAGLQSPPRLPAATQSAVHLLQTICKSNPPPMCEAEDRQVQMCMQCVTGVTILMIRILFTDILDFTVWIILSTFGSMSDCRLVCSYLIFCCFCQSYLWKLYFKALEKVSHILVYSVDHRCLNVLKTWKSHG